MSFSIREFKNILFIDIETAPSVAGFEELSEGMQHQWERKAKLFREHTGEENESRRLFDEKAGIFAEFAKVVCIGMGVLTEEGKVRLKALSGDDESVLLQQFSEAVGRFSQNQRDIRFCGHNIREFDIPFLCRRMVIHSLPLPGCMQLQGKKPWDIPHLDTLELWRFGDYKHYTSLALLAEVLGIPSPKDDIDGSMVGKVYWEEKDTERIARYCLNDVYTTARIYLRMKGQDIIPEKEIAAG